MLHQENVNTNIVNESRELNGPKTTSSMTLWLVMQANGCFMQESGFFDIRIAQYRHRYCCVVNNLSLQLVSDSVLLYDSLGIYLPPPRPNSTN